MFKHNQRGEYLGTDHYKTYGRRAKYKKKIRARENEMKKILARQFILKNIHAMA